MFISPFSPAFGSNQVVTASGTSAAITVNASDRQVRVVNTGANKAYVRCGPSGTVATTADYPIPPNTGTIFTKGTGHTTLAYISATGTTLEVMTGNGF